MNEPPTASVEPDYPLRLDIDHQEQYSRWIPLVKWLLVIPHYIVLIVLWIGAFFAIVAAWFAVLITGRYPRGLWNFVVGVSRWTTRVTAYFYLMVDPYPPFSLEDDPDYPARLELEYPEKVERWRPLVAWILAIPYLIIAGILVYIGYLLAFFAFFTILFARSFPKGMFDIVVVALRWQTRGNAYALWLITRYPPWVWG
jgi:small-conductance mechanosensitive channel